jgi:hypothetical protein
MHGFLLQQRMGIAAIGFLLSGIALADGNVPVQLSCTLIPPPTVTSSTVPERKNNWGIQLIAGGNHETLLGHLALMPEAVVEPTRNGQLQALRLHGFESRLEAVTALERVKKLFPQAFVYRQ